MTSVVQKIGINLGGTATDTLSFSTLRSTFFQSDPDVAVSPATGIVKASDLIRTTVLPTSLDTNGQTNPTCPFDGSKNGVPDATENAGIVTTSTANSNWKISDFQQSVKWYNITQSDTELNYNIATQTWNSNLTKNVVKRMKITGTCGSNSSTAAARFIGSAYNLRIEVSGNIYGYGGDAGGGSNVSFPISGQDGGNALNVTSSTGRVVVNVASTGKIYGGGGGGERGANGANGTTGTCSASTSTSGCGGAPGCPSPYYQTGGIGDGGGCAYVSYCCGFFCCGCVRPTNYIHIRYCVYYATSSSAPGGTGAAGGRGRGYNYQTGTLAGGTGTNGTCPSCSFGSLSGGTCGKKGEDGGAGGNWGAAGTGTNNTGSGGSAGAAVTGARFTVIGTISSTTIKGAYT